MSNVEIAGRGDAFLRAEDSQRGPSVPRFSAVAHGSGPRTLADVIASRRAFVGRSAEIELLAACLAADDPPFHVLFVHGPGGVGKTSLLREMERVATAAGRAAVRVDARDGAAARDGVLEVLATALEVDGDPREAFPEPAVLFVDTYERWESIDPWVREQLVPALPASTVVVIAGRRPPRPGWQGSALGEVTRVLALRNLEPDASRELADRLVRDPHARDAVATQAYGHPLGIALLAEVANAGGDLSDDTWSPHLVAQLVRQFVEVVPSPRHRRALDTLALARVTSEESLRDVFPDEDVHDLFTWLRDLSFVEAGPEGLFPHDLARDALEFDLRWRDPAGFKALANDVRAGAYRRFYRLRGRPQQRAIVDAQFLFHRVPALRGRFDWSTFGLFAHDPATPAHREPVLDRVVATRGEQYAALVRHWWDEQPEAFWVVRDSEDDVRGVLVFLELTRASADAIAVDPIARAAWEHARRTAPPHGRETVWLARDALDLARGDAVGHSRIAATSYALTTQLMVAEQDLALWYFPGRPRDTWAREMAFFGHDLVEDLQASVGDVDVCFFRHDFRTSPLMPWLEDFGRRVIDTIVAEESTPPQAARVVLSRTDFAGAVKQALRDLHQPDLLARNPLARSGLVPDGADAAQALREAVTDAVRRLDADPRNQKLFRALDRTYLRPATTQERAAEVLDLPFSTYRRHLTDGLARVVDALWRQDLGTAR